jgi:hypothetical protein
MMGGKTSETCWAVNKRHDNKLENCCIWLVICLNSHGMFTRKCQTVSSAHGIYLRNIHNYAFLLIMFLHLTTS